jgi:DNA polymerase-3 subunit chi
MTKVDVYLLGNNEPRGRERVACRLVEKAYRLGHRVYLYAPDKPAALEMDELLWTFSQGSFVPHAVCQDETNADAHPVLIGHDEPPTSLHDVLVSLASEVPSWFSRFARVAELVGPGEDDKARGRERYRFYRERGYPLDTHNL